MYSVVTMRSAGIFALVSRWRGTRPVNRAGSPCSRGHKRHGPAQGNLFGNSRRRSTPVLMAICDDFRAVRTVGIGLTEITNAALIGEKYFFAISLLFFSQSKLTSTPAIWTG